ncbi:MAG TPA: hypothetical protein PKY82_19055 [Pyrinomonadaceae bacterium]|nr:hypothetical protein [Pyrinomonadaceae bacterium]
MKRPIKILITIFAMILLNSCINSNQGTSKKTISIKGKVVEIQRGKDGYTAKIETDDKKIYSATISSVTLEKKYREVKIGETIEVEGESVLSDGSLIRVTVLK